MVRLQLQTGFPALPRVMWRMDWQLCWSNANPVFTYREITMGKITIAFIYLIFSHKSFNVTDGSRLSYKLDADLIVVNNPDKSQLSTFSQITAVFISTFEVDLKYLTAILNILLSIVNYLRYS
jgi:hypothetical protein